MHLFLTGVLPFLAHDHPAAAVFLTCRHHNFHASIIPEFLSDEKRVRKFCEARQQNELEADKGSGYTNLFNLFVQTPLMQFSPSLVLRDEDCTESILKPLLETTYFTRTLQRCSVGYDVPLSIDFLQALSKVQSLTELDLQSCSIENEHLEMIINSFPSLDSLSIRNARQLKTVDPKTISMNSPAPAATKTLRNLTMDFVDAFFATEFVPHFTNLRKLALHGKGLSQEFDLLPLSSSLSLLTDLSLERYNLENIESLKSPVHLSSIQLRRCRMPGSLSFLTPENSLPDLRTLRIDSCGGFLTSSSFSSLTHARNLQVLEVVAGSAEFNNGCFQYLQDMIHLRKLDLSHTKIIGDSRSLKTLMQNLFQLEELNLQWCNIGNQGAIAGALFSTHSRLRVLNLEYCSLVDDDLNGIGALKNTLEVLDLSYHYQLTNEALRHCKDLVKLKTLILQFCDGITDLSPLKNCLNLEDLDASNCDELSNDSFKVFSEEPNSFANLRLLDLSYCRQLTEKVFEHLSRNTNLVHQLKELNIKGKAALLSTSVKARNDICQLKGLRKLCRVRADTSSLASSVSHGRAAAKIKKS